MVAWLQGLYNAITQFINSVWDSLTDWAKDFLYWVFETFEGQSREFVTQMLTYVGDMIDAYTEYDFSSITLYLDVANKFLPMTEGMVLLGVWLSFSILIYSTRIIVKLIPWIG